MISILIQAADLIIPVAEQQISHLGRVTHQYASPQGEATDKHTHSLTQTRGNKLDLTVPHSKGSISWRRKSHFIAENLGSVLKGSTLS